jgi:hypothetical protein
LKTALLPECGILPFKKELNCLNYRNIHNGNFCLRLDRALTVAALFSAQWVMERVCFNRQGSFFLLKGNTAALL